MFVSDKLVFVELHKTGCTHIGKLLAELVGGQQRGKHNRPSAELLSGTKRFLGSIRDPWDWYVSLWAYGCDRRGAIYELATKSTIQFKDRGWRGNPLSASISLMRDLARSAQDWKKVYSDVNDPSGFRRWVHMINDKKYWDDFRDGYGESSISPFAGLMTYRYLKLFMRSDIIGARTYNEMKSLESRDCYIDYFIRNECLEDDFIQAMESFGVPISEEKKHTIHSSGKTNISSRNEKAAYYYDRDTVNLVADREKLIIDKFQYNPPAL